MTVVGITLWPILTSSVDVLTYRPTEKVKTRFLAHALTIKFNPCGFKFVGQCVFYYNGT